jgi:hypothetical protein
MHFCSADVGSVVATAGRDGDRALYRHSASLCDSPVSAAKRPSGIVVEELRNHAPRSRGFRLGSSSAAPRTDGLEPGGSIPKPNCKCVSSTPRRRPARAAAVFSRARSDRSVSAATDWLPAKLGGMDYGYWFSGGDRWSSFAPKKFRRPCRFPDGPLDV